MNPSPESKLRGDALGIMSGFPDLGIRYTYVFNFEFNFGFSKKKRPFYLILIQ